MRKAAFAVAFILAGCATTTLNNFSTGMNALVGQQAEVAFQRLGYPDRQETIAGNTAYFWGTDHDRGPSCAFKIVANPAGRIISWDGTGNANGCDYFARRLSR